MHKWISTDGPGIQCYRCGVAIDFDPDDSAQDEAALALIGWCDVASDPESRPHHFVLEGTTDDFGYALNCAYDSARITATTTQIAHHGCAGY